MEHNTHRPKRTGAPGKPRPASQPGVQRAATRSGSPRPTSRGEVPRPASPEAPEKLLAVYRPDLSEALEESSAPAYRQRQVFEHLTRAEIRPFSEATALPADARARLDEAGATTLQVAGRRTATDGTVKLLLACSDDARVETVVMPYLKRTTACISSQAGCPVGCAFCATGAAGFRRNLSTAEIVDQVRAAAGVATERGGRLSNLVYMGMGEPLLNLQAVLSSIAVLTHPRGLNLGHRSISVSTVGIPAGIVRLARAEPQVNLALSLHASSDRTRELLVPARHRHSLADILAAAWEHFALTRRKLMVEYVLLRGVNDSIEDARRLAALLRGRVVTVNLLSWNQVSVAGFDQANGAGSASSPREKRLSAFFPSSRAAAAAFRDVLMNAKVEVTMRQSKGADIEAACGQLAGRMPPPEGAQDQ
jgi:23S rRNA (adenine2503-C2)-methyltransferase